MVGSREILRRFFLWAPLFDLCSLADFSPIVLNMFIICKNSFGISRSAAHCCFLPASARLVPSLVSNWAKCLFWGQLFFSALVRTLSVWTILCVQKQHTNVWLLHVTMADSSVGNVSGGKPGSLLLRPNSLGLTWCSTNTDWWFQEWMELSELQMGPTGTWDSLSLWWLVMGDDWSPETGRQFSDVPYASGK